MAKKQEEKEIKTTKNKVEKTKKMKTGGGHRPSYLFRYKSK